MRRGGSGGAAFSVKTYPSAFPASAKEGTIGIITSTAYPSIVISPIEPETPVSGMIWIKVGTVSAYPVSSGKKQMVIICPVNTYQWDGSAWTQKTAKSYINGAWHDWSKVIISGGVALETMSAKAVKWNDYAIAYAPTVDTNDGAIRLREVGQSGVGYHAGIYEVDVPIDLTPFSKCSINYKTQGNDALVKLFARASQGTVSGTLADVPKSTTYTTAEIDISSMNGEQYFSIAFGDMGTSGSYIWIRSLTLVP